MVFHFLFDFALIFQQGNKACIQFTESELDIYNTKFSEI